MASVKQTLDRGQGGFPVSYTSFGYVYGEECWGVAGGLGDANLEGQAGTIVSVTAVEYYDQIRGHGIRESKAR
jgi:hypothetical protein